MSIDVEKIKKLREETGAGVIDAKKALEDTNGDMEKAQAILMEKGLSKAGKRAEKVAGDGLVFSYIHAGGKVGSLVVLGCETDFVAKTEDFQKLGKEIAMQVATEEFGNTEDLLKSEYIRDASKKISDLIAQTIAKLGEKIEVRQFARFSVR